MSADILERLRAMQAATESGQPTAFVKDIWQVAADEIEQLNETIGNLCLSIAHAAEDIKDGDAAQAQAILNAALKSQDCETV